MLRGRVLLLLILVCLCSFLVSGEDVSIEESDSGFVDQKYDIVDELNVDISAGDQNDEIAVIIELEETPVIEEKHNIDENLWFIPGFGKRILTDMHEGSVERSHENLKDKLKEIDAIESNDDITSSLTQVSNSIIVNVKRSDINKIREQNGVKAVIEDVPIELYLSASVDATGVSDAWKIEDENGDFVTGKGVTIAIIDSGVDYNHLDFGACIGDGCKVADGYDFADNDVDPMDEYGHGTHCAAIAAGNGVNKGVAPDANLYAYKVFSYNYEPDLDEYVLSGSTSAVLAALESSLDPNGDGDFSDHVDVVSMSLGYDSGVPSDTISQAVDNLVRDGIVVVVAAGNSGPGKNTISSPACADEVLAVGAYCMDHQVESVFDEAGTRQLCPDNLGDFSSRGPTSKNALAGSVKPDVIAPGVQICAAKSSYLSKGNSAVCNTYEHIDMTGTSMSAPHVAGLAALVKQAHPDWTAEEIIYAIKSTAVSLDGKSIEDQGHGLVLANSAVELEDMIVSKLNLPEYSDYDMTLRGSARADDFLKYSIHIKKYDGEYEDGWELVEEHSSQITNSVLARVDTTKLPSSKNVLRLRVETKDGKSMDDYMIVDELRNIIVLSPHENTIYAFDAKIDISGFVKGFGFGQSGRKVENVKIKWARGTPDTGFSTEWSNVGVEVNYQFKLEGGETEFIEKIGTWDVSQVDRSKIETGYYTIKLEVDYIGHDIKGEKFIVVKLDRFMKTGWPKMVYSYDDYNLQITDILLADVDGDDENEFVIATRNNNIFTYNSAWIKMYSLSGRGGSSISVGNLVGDDNKEIVSSARVLGSGESMGIKMFSDDYPEVNNNINNVYSIIFDLDQDGENEIIVSGNIKEKISSNENYTIVKEYLGVSVLDNNLNHKTGWNKKISDYIEMYGLEGYASICDIDGDGNYEIVMGSGFDRNAVHVFDCNGKAVDGWPVIFSNNYIEYSGIISPVQCADLDLDGSDEVIVSVSGYTGHEDGKNATLFVILGNGNILEKKEVGEGLYISPNAFGDIDGDKFPEIVTVAPMDKDGNIYLHVFNMDGSEPKGWPRKINHLVGDDSALVNVKLAIGNVLGGSDMDIVMYSRGTLSVLNKNLGTGLAMKFPVEEYGYDVIKTPIIDDIDGDGKNDVIVAVGDKVYVFDFNIAGKENKIHWSGFKGGNLRLGRFDPCSDGYYLDYVFDDEGKYGYGESDIDCGGRCGLCDMGKKCFSDSDCVNNNCASGVCFDVCSDGLVSGDETDVDCGGSCGVCSEGEKCSENSDCDTSFCEDSVCSVPPIIELLEICNNHLDDDEDGMTDCADSDCLSEFVNYEDSQGDCSVSERYDCLDNFDNDGDGKVDCADIDCSGNNGCVSENECADGIDNDGDGRMDCDDFDCYGKKGPNRVTCEAKTEKTCNDNQDNDFDGSIDCADSDCVDNFYCVTTDKAIGIGICELIEDKDCGFYGKWMSKININRFSKSGGRTTVDTGKEGCLYEMEYMDDPLGENSEVSPGTERSDGKHYMSIIAAAELCPDNIEVVLYPNDLYSDSISKGNHVLDDTVLGDVNSKVYVFNTDEMRGSVLYCERGYKIKFSSVSKNGMSSKKNVWTVVGCTGSGEQCNNLLDDDGDGLIDCADKANCADVYPCEKYSETICVDHIDNDGDGKIDCADENCFGVRTGGRYGEKVCYMVEDSSCPDCCSDGFDNDGDGRMDCAELRGCYDICPAIGLHVYDSDGNALKHISDGFGDAIEVCGQVGEVVNVKLELTSSIDGVNPDFYDTNIVRGGSYDVLNMGSWESYDLKFVDFADVIVEARNDEYDTVKVVHAHIVSTPDACSMRRSDSGSGGAIVTPATGSFVAILGDLLSNVFD